MLAPPAQPAPAQVPPQGPASPALAEAGVCAPRCFVAPGPRHCSPAFLRWALPSWGLRLLAAQCSSPAGDLEMFRSCCFPGVPRCWLRRGPFPAGGSRRLLLHGSKWRRSPAIVPQPPALVAQNCPFLWPGRVKRSRKQRVSSAARRERAEARSPWQRHWGLAAGSSFDVAMCVRSLARVPLAQRSGGLPCGRVCGHGTARPLGICPQQPLLKRDSVRKVPGTGD